MLTPVFSILWVRLRERQPSSPVKFTLGMLFIGVAYLLMIPAAVLTAQERSVFGGSSVCTFSKYVARCA